MRSEAAPRTARLVSVGDAATCAVVELDPSPACARCAAGGGCGAALFAPRTRPVRIECRLPPGLRPPPGARVALALPEEAGSRWLGLVLRAYGLPTAGLLGGAMAPEPWAPWTALAGLLGGLLAWRLSEGRAARAADGSVESAVPNVTGVIPGEMS